MKMSKEVQAQYEANRMRMHELDKRFKIYFWSNIALSSIIFCSALIAGALSTLEKNTQGAEKFYFAMSAGVFQILLALATILLGWITASRRRVPSLILLGIYAVSLLMILLGQNGTFAAANTMFLVFGGALNVWIQMIFNQLDELKEYPGYPLFSVMADTAAEYEIPLNVLMRQTSSEMESIDNPIQTASKADAAAVLEPIDSVNQQIEEIAEDAALQRRQQPCSSAPLPDIALETLNTAAEKSVEGVLPQVNAEELLSDMSAETASHNYGSDFSALPDPDEVKARLAAMRNQRSAE